MYKFWARPSTHRRTPRLAALGALLLAASLPPTTQGQTTPPWQQRVAYDMDITVLTDRHQLRGDQRVVYVNNSPDTLTHIFYHLYFNAFQPNSMMAERNRHLPDPDSRIVPRIFELGPGEIGYHRVQTLTQDGEPLAFEVNDTVLRADLAAPIPPGGTSTFVMRFDSQVPLQTRRSGRDSRGGGIDFSMTQWYPKIAEYDERGWHADPYVGREFYGVFGTFDVRLTLPADYMVAATGTLVNRGAIGYGYDRPGLDVQATGSASDSLTWHFTAENVHDFAWGADPAYVHDHLVLENGMRVHLLYKPDVADSWQPLRTLMPRLVAFFNEEYGVYPYPQFTVVQGADGGMEYPMLTFVSGYTAGFTRPRSAVSVLGTTVHEYAHMWYYGVLANNEADYSWMDEGFTSYATTEGMAHLLGRPEPSHLGAYLNVLALQEQGAFERLNTPADWFETNRAFGVASYSGGEMVVEMLGYVMSDRLRDVFLNEYFERYRFRHVNPYDVEKVAEDVSGLRLDWYFEQFLNTTRTMDYALTGLRSRPSGEGWRTEVTLERRDEVVMPMDVRLTLADGSTHWATIPLGIMQGHKPVPDDWTVAEPWFWTFPEYTLTVDLPARVVAAEIDPELKTPDRNRLNNTSDFPRTTRFLQPAQPSYSTYGIGWRPLAQYSEIYGVGAGLRAEGTYIFDDYRATAMLKLWPQVLASGGDEPEYGNSVARSSTAWDGIDYTFRYDRDLEAVSPLTSLTLSAEKHQGILENRVTLSHRFGRWARLGAGPEQHLSLTLLHQANPTDRAFQAPFSVVRTLSSGGFGPPDTERLTQRINPFQRLQVLSAVASYEVGEEDEGVRAFVEVGSSVNDVTSATRAGLSAVKTTPLGPLRLRTHVQLGTGADNLMLHKAFRLGGPTFEERWRSNAFRTAAGAFLRPWEEAHLVALGAAGPRAYLLEGTRVGRNVMAGTVALHTGPIGGSPWLRPLTLEAYVGAGSAWSTASLSDGFDDVVADAGVALRYDVAALAPLRRWVQQSSVLSGLDLVLTAPLWVSDPDLIDETDEVGARFLIGIQVRR